MDYFAELGDNCIIQENVILGLKYRDGCEKVRIGNQAIIRAFSVIYADVVIGDYFRTRHNIVIRKYTKIGSRIVIGSETVIDGYVEI